LQRGRFTSVNHKILDRETFGNHLWRYSEPLRG
jgi:hypothetical protein